ncbi:chorismate--pyruvate lyase [Mariprofundus micogutta]|uniref:Chorismate--pyruvate lyase n=1 Tax=Mariprofundus micogutta TaxID=1921010 RepID=A0A1L8CPH2_9PROT|nr:chorismate lyase [Mariprofundus micogutta]GAV20820.1 chorismate--pyruvate lyase [Mariprofundus micogutta]
MFFGSLESQDWQSVRHWKADDAGVSRDAAAVLTTAGSLTRFLERHFGIKLEVRLHDQFVDMALLEEAQLLGCEPGDRALRRQVSLMHRGSVLFDAESVLPLEDLPADLMRDLEEGKRPLGNLLLDRGLSLSRSDLSVVQLQADGGINGCWARRSVLRSPSGTRALVVELFHPEMWKRLESSSRRYSVRDR